VRPFESGMRLLQWPTLLTLAMFPILVWMYVRLAIVEERDSERAFGQAWRDYAAQTPRFFPRFGAPVGARGGEPHPIAKQ
jgi:protein-S-isoprenylcysteine O-methyltransferase Ste14